jgi:hypothetical protein
MGIQTEMKSGGVRTWIERNRDDAVITVPAMKLSWEYNVTLSFRS